MDRALQQLKEADDATAAIDNALKLARKEEAAVGEEGEVAAEEGEAEEGEEEEARRR